MQNTKMGVQMTLARVCPAAHFNICEKSKILANI